MKIALVAPSSVPFVLGGAERLWWGLASHVNRHTGDAMELIKLPSPERNFWEIGDSYRRFSQLDLDHFDMVLSTKYPAWMVAHQNHIVYLQHTLRGLYDTYPPHLPQTPGAVPAALAPLWNILQRRNLDRSALPDLFGAFDDFRTSMSISDEKRERLAAFPGPLARTLVQALDRIGLAPGAIRRYLAISRTVAERHGYFPPGATVTVVPHPSDLEGFQSGVGEFVFTASRLDPAKRVDLLIKAYRRCRAAVPLVIAGDGPAEGPLRALAKDDARIRFVGRLTDDDLLAHYARSHFVAFIPFQEDMGLITLEAMKSGKPVLTVSDAGGVTEFVRDGINGRVVAPEVDSLARAIDAMMADQPRLLAMGEAARATGAEVSWERTVDALLGPAAQLSAPAAKPARAARSAFAKGTAEAPRTRILVLNTFGVFPPNSGGKKRIFCLYEALARHADITLLNLGAPGSASELREFGAHFREIRIPPSERFQAADAALRRALRRSVTDIATLLYAHEIPMLESAMTELMAESDVVVASHVYLAPLIARHWKGELWYDAHNVEADMKADILGVERAAAPFVDATPGVGKRDVASATAVVGSVARAERTLVQAATRVLAASEQDVRRLAELYGRDIASIEYVPNGVSLPDDPWLEHDRRARLKASLGFADRPVALFVGSDHGPNHEAADVLVTAARGRPQWAFVVAGSICDYAGLRRAPDNVLPVGLVAQAELSTLLRAADVGLNPMLRGSGTNLKMLDYAAHGALVLSTEIGARGLGFVADTHYISFEPERLAQLLESLEPELPSPRLPMRTAARELAEKNFSWRTIADRIAAAGRAA